MQWQATEVELYLHNNTYVSRTARMVNDFNLNIYPLALIYDGSEEKNLDDWLAKPQKVGTLAE